MPGRAFRPAIPAVLAATLTASVAIFAADVGLLVDKNLDDRSAREARAAFRLAGRFSSPAWVFPAPGGKFVDKNGRDVSLEQFQLVWVYQGKPTGTAGPLCEAASLAALRKYVGDGHGLLLSGAALAMVQPLGIGTIELKPLGMFQDRGQVPLVPLVVRHPVFRGLSYDGSAVWLNNAAYPAFADFDFSLGAKKGSEKGVRYLLPERPVAQKVPDPFFAAPWLLARTPGLAKNQWDAKVPLLEYQLGKGRVIAMGWRLMPRFSNRTDGFRANFERLTGNIIQYLGDPGQWWDIAADPVETAAPVSAYPIHEQGAAAKWPQSIYIPAWTFDRCRNLKTFTTRYADAGPVVAALGPPPLSVEYDIDFPVTAEYTFCVCFTAKTVRPVELYFDGKHLGQACRTATGSWDSSGAAWEETCRLSITKGKHTVKLTRGGSFPHVVGLRFDCPVAFPAGWQLHWSAAAKLRERAVTAPRLPPAPEVMFCDPSDVDIAALRLAITDLSETFGPRYAKGREYLKRLDALEQALQSAGSEPEELRHVDDALALLSREALSANPLLDFDRLLLVRRSEDNLGLPQNWQSNSSLKPTGYDNQIAVLSPVRRGQETRAERGETRAERDSELTTLYQPPGGQFVGDVDLHSDANRMLFSMPNAKGQWRVYEIGTDGSGLRQLPLIDEPDVGNYDACYLPDGRIVFSSTAPFIGVPCVRGSSHVTNLYLLETDGSIRRLTVDQDHNWCPTVTNSGRVMYLRWEYTDTPHAFLRILFQMNPDGSGQMECYGSNSYWPNTMFYARPIPGHPTKLVAVVGSYHGEPRSGELVVFDPARGRRESQGAVQRIPGRGRRVEAVIVDWLTDASWPKFLHPYPLSEKYFLVSCKPDRNSPWGVYLVDVFDNMLLLYAEPGYAMLEPIPLKPVPKPPVIHDKVVPERKEATVFMADVYTGEGMKGVPRGTIKALRLVGYHFSYHGMGGFTDRLGLDGPWDVKRIIGTVPVHEDGSAHFRVPAYTPISIQPLDAEGKAVQLMRSWFTAVPGEVLSCVGCHEKQNTAPPQHATLAAVLPPAEIRPWYGPPRGFSFKREVQPVLDKRCIGCHNGQPQPDGREIADLTDRPQAKPPGSGRTLADQFSPSYYQLWRFVRGPTIESDVHVLMPWEFHADTTELVQMLRKGHHNVQLDRGDWDRLITWIDLNTPAHGIWAEARGAEPVRLQEQRRREMLNRYTSIDEDPEAIYRPPQEPVEPIVPEPLPAPASAEIECDGWPCDATEAVRRQTAAGTGLATIAIELDGETSLQMTLIPAGRFVMGSTAGCADERPAAAVTIDKPFWMGTFEVTNRQYALFDPSHSSGYEHSDCLHYTPGERGFPLIEPEQPVVRVSWRRAMAFCRWLSEKTGRRFTLPTEAQWEYACRAGSATSLWYGPVDADFSPFANVSDATHESVDDFGWPGRRTMIPPWRPADVRHNDRFRVAAPVGSFSPNPWGLYDMHGNVAEWTRSGYRPYPYDARDGRNDDSSRGLKIIRGGSWCDRPVHCGCAFRLSYHADQPVFDIGFRVMCETACNR